MQASTTSTVARETAHVLFMDLVGFSRKTGAEQKQLLEGLRDLLRQTEEYRRAHGQGQVLCVPAGDGAAVVFFGDPVAPVRCAIELGRAARDRGGFLVRMGIHCGPVERTTDINGNPNFVGPGMNLAQRVMDCGDAGHILLSEVAAQLLSQTGEHRHDVHELGTFTVKHQERLVLYNFYGQGFGNPQVPVRLLLPREGGEPEDANSPTGADASARRSGPILLLLHPYPQRAPEAFVDALEQELRARGARLLEEPAAAPRMIRAERLIHCIEESTAVVVVVPPGCSGSEVLDYALHAAREAARRRDGSPRLCYVRVVDDAGTAAEVPNGSAPASLLEGRDAADARRIAGDLLQALAGPTTTRERRGGAESSPPVGPVPLGSPYYVLRPSDEVFASALERRDTVILVKGARQMGKTSLLARGLRQMRDDRARVVFMDFQKWHNSDLASTEAFFLSLAETFAYELDLATPPAARWNPGRAPGINFERYLGREVLGKTDAPLVWVMDEVDRLLDFGFSSEVFGLFRSWYGARQTEPDGPWSRLMLVIAYATEAHYFIRDPNQSPFNVGTTVRLRDFTSQEVAALNRRLDSPLRDEGEVARFHRLLGGQPFLVRSGLREIAEHGIGLAAFERLALRDDGPFSDHLQYLLLRLARDRESMEVVRAVLRGERCPTVESFFKLRTAGILTGESPLDARPRCQLYAAFLERHLR